MRTGATTKDLKVGRGAAAKDLQVRRGTTKLTAGEKRDSNDRLQVRRGAAGTDCR